MGLFDFDVDGVRAFRNSFCGRPIFGIEGFRAGGAPHADILTARLFSEMESLLALKSSLCCF